MNTLIQNIKYKLISKISPFMTHPNQPVNQAQQFLHITGSEDLNADQITERVQSPNNCEQQPVGKEPVSEQPQHANILMEGFVHMRRNVTRSQLYACDLKNKVHHIQIEQSIPEPLESDEEQSQQAQYMSYLQNPVVYEQVVEGSQPSQELLRHKLPYADRNEFLSILYQSMVYVRKEERRTKIDDELLADRLNGHFVISTTPTSITQIGRALLANGYFLVAFSILMGRINRSEVLFRYVVEKFKDNVDNIEDNLQDFMCYNNRPNQYFQIISQELLKSTRRSSNITIQLPRPHNLKRMQPSNPNCQQEQQNQNDQNQTPNNKVSKEPYSRMKSTKITNVTSHNKKEVKQFGDKCRDGSPDC